MSINKIVLTGNLTRDAELRYSQSGTAISVLGIAVNEKVKNSATSEWEDYVNFFECTLFGKRAEALDPYLKKGQKIGIDGHLRYSSWEAEGQKRSKVSVIVDNLELLGAKKTGKSKDPVVQEPSGYENVAPEDIPF